MVQVWPLVQRLKPCFWMTLIITSGAERLVPPYHTLDSQTHQNESHKSIPAVSDSANLHAQFQTDDSDALCYCCVVSCCWRFSFHERRCSANPDAAMA